MAYRLHKGVTQGRDPYPRRAYARGHASHPPTRSHALIPLGASTGRMSNGLNSNDIVEKM